MKMSTLAWATIAGLFTCTGADAAYVRTAYLTNLSVYSDNGKTYFEGGFTTQGNCLYNRLDLRETGDFYNNLENSKRMYALILAARFAGKAISLGYLDTDGPECRLAEVFIQW